MAALVAAFDEARTVKGKPTCILAQTLKGKHFPDIEDSAAWHGKPLGASSEAVIAHVTSLIKAPSDKLAHELLPIAQPTNHLADSDISDIRLSAPPQYTLGQRVATRLAYGTGLVKLGKNNPQVS